jgi:hypothetical protein
MGLTTEYFIERQAALKAASSEAVKQERTCSHNQHAFIPFAFDTFGFPASNDVDMLKTVQKVIHNNVVSHRSQDIVFNRIDLAIDYGLASSPVCR